MFKYHERCPYCSSYNTVDLRHDCAIITAEAGAVSLVGCVACGLTFLSTADRERIKHNLEVRIIEARDAEKEH